MAHSHTESSLEQEIFRCHYSKLYEILSSSESEVISLTNRLYSEGIIGKPIRDKIHTSKGTSAGEKACTLLNSVESTILTHPEHFQTFCYILANVSNNLKKLSDELINARQKPRVKKYESCSDVLSLSNKDEIQEEWHQPSNPARCQTLSDDLKENEVKGITPTIEESEDKSEPSNTRFLSDEHSIQQPEYHSQLSLPIAKQPNMSVNFDRSKSDPAYISKLSKPRFTKQLNNPAWQVFDKFFDQIVNIISSNEVLCANVLEQLSAKFLIYVANKDVVDQLTCPAIKSRAMMDAVGSFISRGRGHYHSLRKLMKVLSCFDEMRPLVKEMTAEAIKYGVDIQRQTQQKIPQSPAIPSGNGIVFDSQDAHASSTIHIQKYADHLRKCYKRWCAESSTKPALYVDLAVVEKDDYYSNEMFSTVHCSVDDVTKMSRSISLDELCQIPFGSLILIEGAPGIGKSHLAFEICIRWVDKQSFEQYSLLLLLHLRERSIQKSASVEDLLGCFLLSQSWKQQAIQDIIDNDGKGVLIILEGYDELPDKVMKDKESVFFKLVTALPEATVIITTRPSAKQHLNHYKLSFSQHIEVIGFTKSSIVKYVEKCFEHRTEKIQNFHQYVGNFPQLAGCLYIPIILDIVLRSFQFLSDEKQVDIPQSITELYTVLIKMRIYRHLKKSRPEENIHFTKLEELPKPELEAFHHLCGMAYQGIRYKEKQLIFYQPSDQYFETLGLMRKEHQLLPTEGDVFAYNFLHLTIQEFLAAYHLHLLPCDKIQNCFDKYRGIPSLFVMMRFLAGLTGLKFVSLSIPDNLCDLNTFHQLFETRNNALISNFLSGGTEVVYKVSRVLPIPTPYDMYMLGYCIALSQCSWRLTFTLRNISDEHLEKFKAGLLTVDVQPNYQIKDINLSLNPVGNKGVGFLLDLPQHILSNLFSLCLRGVNVDVGCLGDLVKKFPHFSKLQTFLFHNNHFKEGEQLPLITTICQSKTIQHVSFSKLSPDECSHLLTNSKLICSLDVYQLSPPSIETVITCLSKDTTLEILQIHQSEVKAEFIAHLPTSLPSSHLKSLEFINCAIDSVTVHIIANAVMRTPTLEKLDLSDNLIDDKGGDYLVDMIHAIILLNQTDMKSNFKELCLDHNPFTESTISRLIDKLSLCNQRSFLKIHLSLKWKEYVQSHPNYQSVEKYLKFGNMEES